MLKIGSKWAPFESGPRRARGERVSFDSRGTTTGSQLRVAWIVPGGVGPDPRRPSMPILRSLAETWPQTETLRIYSLEGSRDGTHSFGQGVVREWRREGGLRPSLDFWRLWRQLKADGPFDVIHGFWATSPGFLAVALARSLGSRSVVSVLGGELVHLPDLGYGGGGDRKTRRKTHATLRWADSAHGLSSGTVELGRRLGLHLECLPMGVERRPYTEKRERSGPLRILAVGSRNRVKDHGTLLRGFAGVLASIPELSLDIIGEDAGGEDARVIQELRIGHAVRLLGFVPHAQLADHYARADLFVHSSRHEGGAQVVREAAMHGLPIVGTNVGYVADWHPRAAIAVPVGDPEALARRIHELCTNEALRTQLSQAAHARSWQEDVGYTINRYMELYERLKGLRG